MHPELKILVRKKDWNSISEIVKSKLPVPQKIKFMLLYGSKKRDLDVVVVYDNNAINKQEYVYQDSLDISAHPIQSFSERVKLFDIELVEPILNGEIIFGDKEYLDALQKYLKTTDPTDDCARFACKKSLSTLAAAKYYLDQHRYMVKTNIVETGQLCDDIKQCVLTDEALEVPHKTLMHSLNCLKFSLTYRDSAEHYLRTHSLIRYHDILVNNDLVGGINFYFKEIEHSDKKPSREVVLHYLNEVSEKAKNSTLERRIDFLKLNE